MTDDLKALEARIRRGLEITGYPAPNWVKARAAPDGSSALDILIVGGGTLGVMLAHGLRRQGMTNFRIVEREAPGREGPWATTAPSKWGPRSSHS